MNSIFNWHYDEGIIFINEPAELNAILSSAGGPAAGGGAAGGGTRVNERKRKKDKTSKRKTRK